MFLSVFLLDYKCCTYCFFFFLCKKSSLMNDLSEQIISTTYGFPKHRILHHFLYCNSSVDL